MRNRIGAMQKCLLCLRRNGSRNMIDTGRNRPALSNPVQVSREPVADRAGAGAAAVPQYRALPGYAGRGWRRGRWRGWSRRQVRAQSRVRSRHAAPRRSGADRGTRRTHA
jgi:hypothetical protein